ncbi:DUF3015 domain-containing protein [Pseudomonas sp. BJa5]|uniref:DUF3015 domain-containing protein n=1 Tax=Pseudomonas sp. BJa5 TaxID=2936270 RepID=UPI002559A6A1|nr:DUF3015 domain-containing protein [Pseudomonas sp. BGr12]MDL2419798.1 DUF3015 domain-containing protein [Pseudomonas sp. BGr12]
MATNLIGKILIFGILSTAGVMAHAGQAGGGGCGWGNMLFDGKSGLGPHLLATTTNGTSGNATFGLTSGTNGCDSSVRLGYGGRSWLAMNGMLDSVAEDMAQGHGEALDAYATLLGIEQDDRAHFAKVAQDNFATIFSAPDVTGEQVLTATLDVMSRDQQLARYVRQPS